MIPRTKEPKPKVCKVCRHDFEPRLPMATCCSLVCALSFAKSNRGKAEKVAAVKDRRETKTKLEKLKSKAQWAREAQTAFNEWIRLRDADQPCISCGRHHQGQYHAGHYLSVGARPELRFEPLNVHKQCAPCNTHLSGNAVLFRKGLLVKHGVQVVEWLEGPHPLRHHSVDDYKAIKADYTAKTKALKHTRDLCA